MYVLTGVCQCSSTTCANKTKCVDCIKAHVLKGKPVACFKEYQNEVLKYAERNGIEPDEIQKWLKN